MIFTNAFIMSTQQSNNNLIFGKINYILILVGLMFLGIGLLLMIGGTSEDPNVFKPEELYSFRRITLAPIIILIGLLIEAYAILVKPKS